MPVVLDLRSPFSSNKKKQQGTKLFALSWDLLLISSKTCHKIQGSKARPLSLPEQEATLDERDVSFAAKGARIAALDKSRETLEETRSTVLSKYPDTTIFAAECDVTDASSVQTAIDATAAELGDIHMLWNNAGYRDG